jgi:hypothetical protein
MNIKNRRINIFLGFIVALAIFTAAYSWFQAENPPGKIAFEATVGAWARVELRWG